MNSRQILVVEDEPALAAALGAMVRRLGFEAVSCYSGQRALEELTHGAQAAAIVDIGLPDMNGLKLVEQIRAKQPLLPVLVITAHGNLDNALAAKKLGSVAYRVKPLDLPEMEESIRGLLAARQLVPAEPARPSTPDVVPLIVGAAPAMQRPFIEISHACGSDVPVLISGPTGTGKTLAARVIHGNSARQKGPFVTLHCSALPEALLESELFGFEKNAFTGALAMRTGHLERAAGGTLFLDEIGDIPLSIQAKLLRFVEEKMFTRIGGREDLRADVRLITATHRDLRAEVRAGRFREDLFYRLHVLEVELPPLFKRQEDIPALCAVFLAAIAPGRSLQLAPDALKAICLYPWPGNVRELRNALEHAAAVSSGESILYQHLPRDLRHTAAAEQSAENLEGTLARWIDEQFDAGMNYDQMHDRLEAMLLEHLLIRYQHRPSVMARELHINRVTLRKKIREYFGGAGEEDPAPSE